MLELLSTDDQSTVAPLIASLTPSDAAVFRRSSALKSEYRAIRVAAHGVLGRIGTAVEDTAILVDCLCGLDDYSVRAASAGSLGDLYSSAQYNYDGVAHNRSGNSVSEADVSQVLDVLQRYSSPAQEKQYIVRYSCISALGLIGNVQSVPFLTTVSATPLEISGAVTALGDIIGSVEYEHAVEYLCSNKTHADDLVRGAIVRTFGIWKFKDDLRDMLEYEDSSYNSPYVRNMLAQALLHEP